MKIPPNPADADSYHQGTSGQRGYNLLHLNALYDLESHLYQDALVQKDRKKHEAQAMIAMAERQSFRAIVLADRNYESYNLMAHLEKQSWYYLIRAKEGKKGTASALRLPETPKIDLSFTQPEETAPWANWSAGFHCFHLAMESGRAGRTADTRRRCPVPGNQRYWWPG